MISKLLYKQKCYGLALLLTMVLYLMYNLSIRETITLLNQTIAKKERLAWLAHQETALPGLQQKVRQLEDQYLTTDTRSVRDILTKKISSFAEKHECTVTDIPGYTTCTRDNIRIQTNSFVIRGAFQKLVVLLDELEHNERSLATVTSARFYTINDVRRKQVELYLFVVTQALQQNNAI